MVLPMSAYILRRGDAKIIDLNPNPGGANAVLYQLSYRG